MQKDAEVEKFLKEYEHPMQAEIQILRQIILDLSLNIREGVKWNSMSFQTSEWFATFNKRETTRIEFVLHLGAKVRAENIREVIPDPAGLLKWLAEDRALMVIRDAADLEVKRVAVTALMTEWIRNV